MWLWRPNRAKARLIARIICVTLAAHLCLMGLLFLSYGQSVRSFIVKAQKPLQGQRIIVLPFNKKRAHPAPSRRPPSSGDYDVAMADRSPFSAMPGLRQKTAQRSAGKSRGSANTRTPLQQKTAVLTKQTAIAANVPEKSKALEPTMAKKESKKAEPLKTAPQKTVAKKPHVPAKKKDAVKKQPEKKQPVPTVKPTQEKTPKIEKKPEPDVKKTVQEVEEKPASVQEPAANPVEPSAPTPNNPLSDEKGSDDADAVYMDHDEYDIFIMHEQIQAEVARCWRPPPGVAAHTSCTLVFYVNWQGQVTECTTLKPSPVLMFDMSARASLKDMVFPRSSYGKEIKLTFIEEQAL